MIEIATEQKLKKEEMGMICSEMNSLLRQSHAVKKFTNFGDSEFKFEANFIFKNETDIIWLLGPWFYESFINDLDHFVFWEILNVIPCEVG